MRLPTRLLVIRNILTDILSRTVSKLSPISVPILDEKRSLCVYGPFGGLRGNVCCSSYAYCKASSGFVLIELFSLSVMAEALRENIEWKSAFLKGVGLFRPNS